MSPEDLNDGSTHHLLVGHALENDLKALSIIHYRCFDTAILFPIKLVLRIVVRSGTCEFCIFTPYLEAEVFSYLGSENICISTSNGEVGRLDTLRWKV